MENLNPDLNEDGIVSEREVKLLEKKMKTQRQMTWVALSSMLVVTLPLLTPFVPIERVDVLSDLLGLFYISMAGICAAYMGVTAWLSRK